MFNDLKMPDEPGYNPDKDQLKEGSLNEENMKTVVENLFKKAQNEEEYCIFYGELCEKIIRLELILRGM